jgi:hypothetical protein
MYGQKKGVTNFDVENEDFTYSIPELALWKELRQLD